MEDIDSSPALPNSRKRPAPDDASPSKKPLNLKGTQFMVPTPADTEGSSNASPSTSSNAAADRGASPTPSCSTILSSVEVLPANPDLNAQLTLGTAAVGISSASSPAAKRRKITPAEKLERAKEKELKVLEKAEEKARKEEERARKEEEKRAKDVEKQKKAEEREAKKRDKELEEERKTQEKLKKERSQMRLGCFFQAKPTTPSKTPNSKEGPAGCTRRKSLSLEPFDAVADQLRQSISPSKQQNPAWSQLPDQGKNGLSDVDNPPASDYHKTFLPFALPSHSTFALMHQSDHTGDGTDTTLAGFEQELAAGSCRTIDVKQYFPATSRGLDLPKVKDIAERIMGSGQVIDLTQDTPLEIMTDVLKFVPIKHIRFHEDVRPPYCGTYTKVESTRASRAPFARFRPDTDYEYDSEAEWEEPEDGEDIVSEDEDDADSQADADEIDAFLDDSEDALKNRRRMITGDLVPESTGICWIDSMGRMKQPPEPMRGTSMGFLLPDITIKSINPFTTSYWDFEGFATSERAALDNRHSVSQNCLLPSSRPPLQPRISGNGSPSAGLTSVLIGLKGPVADVQIASGIKRGRKPASKALSKEDLEEFRNTVVDREIGKLDLLKVLKTRFPRMTHDTIKETLGSQFAQVGTTRSAKRWIYVGNA